MLVGPVDQWEVWAAYSQRKLASSNIHTSTTASRQERSFAQKYQSPKLSNPEKAAKRENDELTAQPYAALRGTVN